MSPCFEQEADVFYFAGDGNGEFSLKKVYKSIVGLEKEVEDNAPERCRCFVWLMKHDRLLTNLSKSRKGLDHASCKICGNACESTLHVIRDCAKAMHIWKSIVPRSIFSEFFSLDLQNWIRLNLKYLGDGIKSWSNVWVISCHAI